jgi:hypothetical protein
MHDGQRSAQNGLVGNHQNRIDLTKTTVACKINQLVLPFSGLTWKRQLIFCPQRCGHMVKNHRWIEFSKGGGDADLGWIQASPYGKASLIVFHSGMPHPRFNCL